MEQDEMTAIAIPEVTQQTDEIVVTGTGLLTQARALVIQTDEDDVMAKTAKAAVTQGLKAWEIDRKKLTDPLEGVKKDIIARYKAAMEPAVQAEKILARKIGDYFMAKQEAARKEEARLRALADKRQERAVQKAEERGEEAPLPVIAMPTVAAPAKTTQVEGGKVTTAMVWVWKLVDENKLPRMCLSMDTVKINGLVRAGLRQIDGLDIYQEAQVR